MTTIAAKVIADSVSADGIRLTTLELRYPRPIHAEVMTHRQFSRNASSSRAIPVKRVVEDVERDPFVPRHWGKNQPGMQAKESCDTLVRVLVPEIDITQTDGMSWNDGVVMREQFLTREEAWLVARDFALHIAKAFDRAGYHKQVVNRLLEPFGHIKVVVTTTGWNNFLFLRDHPDAEPHIADLAREVRKALSLSRPRLLLAGEWHLPYVEDADHQRVRAFLGRGFEHEVSNHVIRLSVARCARVSYNLHDGRPPAIEDDLRLYDDLVASEPLHASPAEHQAEPDRMLYDRDGPFATALKWERPHLHGNLTGWCQYRKSLKGEFVRG